MARRLFGGNLPFTGEGPGETGRRRVDPEIRRRSRRNEKPIVAIWWVGAANPDNGRPRKTRAELDFFSGQDFYYHDEDEDELRRRRYDAADCRQLCRRRHRCRGRSSSIDPPSPPPTTKGFFVPRTRRKFSLARFIKGVGRGLMCTPLAAAAAAAGPADPPREQRCCCCLLLSPTRPNGVLNHPPPSIPPAHLHNAT